MIAGERLRFLSGSELTAADLRAEERSERSARELHVRAVHGTWGVALGYVVGALGRLLVVGPGIAYDCRGRELLSSRTVALEAPKPRDDLDEAWFDLGIRRAGDEELHDQGGLCPPGAPERPHFVWLLAGNAEPRVHPAPSDALHIGETVPLARVRVDSNGIVELTLRERRAARPAAGARVAGGSVSVRIPRRPLTTDYDIDTGAAGFHETPFYFASLSTASSASPKGFLGVKGILGPFLSISGATSAHFTLTIRFARKASAPGPIAFDAAVDWIGVEPIRGCWPPVRPLAALADAGVLLAGARYRLGRFAYQPALGPLDPPAQEA